MASEFYVRCKMTLKILSGHVVTSSFNILRRAILPFLLKSYLVNVVICWVGFGHEHGDISQQRTAHTRSNSLRACAELLPVTRAAGDQRPIRNEGDQWRHTVDHHGASDMARSSETVHETRRLPGTNNHTSGHLLHLSHLATSSRCSVAAVSVQPQCTSLSDAEIDIFLVI